MGAAALEPFSLGIQALPDGASSRLGMFSARFDGGEVEAKIRRVYKILKDHRFNVLMVAAKGGDDFGTMTMQYLNETYEKRGVIISVCTRHYGEKTSSSYSSFKELRYAQDWAVDVLPLRMHEVYPPEPPSGPGHKFDKKGEAKALIRMIIPPSLAYIDCRELSETEIARKIADSLLNVSGQEQPVSQSAEAPLPVPPRGGSPNRESVLVREELELLKKSKAELEAELLEVKKQNERKEAAAKELSRREFVHRDSLMAASAQRLLPPGTQCRYEPTSSIQYPFLPASIEGFNDLDGTYNLDVRPHADPWRVAPMKDITAEEAWPRGTPVYYKSIQQEEQGAAALLPAVVKSFNEEDSTYNLDIREHADCDRIRVRVIPPSSGAGES